MDVRSAAPADSEAIRQVSALSCRAAYEDILDDETLIETMEDPAMSDRIEAGLREVRDDETVVYLVATASETDRLLGFAQLLAGERTPERTAPDEAFLKSLYVHPNHWGEGVGSALLDEGTARLPASTTALSLAVLADNDIGRGFYESRGFEYVGPSAFEVGGVSYDTVIYERSLARSCGDHRQ
jgi:ribosomal protein S18 acetylase RimI-like enzyme